MAARKPAGGERDYKLSASGGTTSGQLIERLLGWSPHIRWRCFAAMYRFGGASRAPP